MIAFLVSGNLRCPEVSVGFGHRVELAALVTMPEAAMDEDDGAVLGEDDVRGAGEALDIDPVTEAEAPEGVPQAELRLRGGGVDGGHIFMALFWSVIIWHSAARIPEAKILFLKQM